MSKKSRGTFNKKVLLAGGAGIIAAVAAVVIIVFGKRAEPDNGNVIIQEENEGIEAPFADRDEDTAGSRNDEAAEALNGMITDGISGEDAEAGDNEGGSTIIPGNTEGETMIIGDDGASSENDSSDEGVNGISDGASGEPVGGLTDGSSGESSDGLTDGASGESVGGHSDAFSGESSDRNDAYETERIVIY